MSMNLTAQMIRMEKHLMRYFSEIVLFLFLISLVRITETCSSDQPDPDKTYSLQKLLRIFEEGGDATPYLNQFFGSSQPFSSGNNNSHEQPSQTDITQSSGSGYAHAKFYQKDAKTENYFDTRKVELLLVKKAGPEVNKYYHPLDGSSRIDNLAYFCPNLPVDLTLGEIKSVETNRNTFNFSCSGKVVQGTLLSLLLEDRINITSVRKPPKGFEGPNWCVFSFDLPPQLTEIKLFLELKISNTLQDEKPIWQATSNLLVMKTLRSIVPVIDNPYLLDNNERLFGKGMSYGYPKI